MNQRICDRCEKRIDPGKAGFLRTKEVRTTALLRTKEASDFFIEYDLCPDCKALFLDFMEGEAIPPCKTTATQ